MTELEKEDIQRIAEQPFDWHKLDNKTIMISGGTGFIGTFIIDILKYRNEQFHQNIKVVSLSRSGGVTEDCVEYIKADINNPIVYDGNVDFVLHLASNTHPKQYAEDPVGTITTNVIGCNNLLHFAKEKNVQRYLLASSVEIYGEGKNTPISEEYCGYINCNLARSGYNEAKRTCEALCQSYRMQHNSDIVIARLARVFGADKKKDTKALAEFINNAVNKESIVLKSLGFQRYSFCYVADAASAIIYLLLNGKNGEAYNVSAENEDLTLKDCAEYVAKLADAKVIYQIENNQSTSKVNWALLNIEKIKSIGWKPLYGVREAIKRTYMIYREREF